MSSVGAARFEAINSWPYAYIREPASSTDICPACPISALRALPKSNCGSMAWNSQCRSDSGTPSRMQIICIGNSAATSTTKSNGTPGSTESNSPRARARRSSSTLAIIRGVRPELTRRRIFECRGSSIMFSTWPAIARSCSRVPPYGREPPVTDEYVTGSLSTASVSEYDATDQKPSPSGVFSVAACQYTGAWRRCTSNNECGKPEAKLSRSVKSIADNPDIDVTRSHPMCTSRPRDSGPPTRRPRRPPGPPDPPPRPRRRRLPPPLSADPLLAGQGRVEPRPAQRQPGSGAQPFEQIGLVALL